MRKALSILIVGILFIVAPLAEAKPKPHHKALKKLVESGAVTQPEADAATVALDQAETAGYAKRLRALTAATGSALSLLHAEEIDKLVEVLELVTQPYIALASERASAATTVTTAQ